MDSKLKKDEGYSLTYTSSEMPTYSPAQYSADIQGYYTELEWPNSALDTSRSIYSIAPRQDLSALQYYPSYQPVSHPELYQSPILWPEGALQVPACEAPISNGISRRESGKNGNSSSGRPKRRRTQSIIQRRAANVRERRRMFQLNEAFDELRKRLPAFNYEKRLSRIETLRLAMTYISFMHEVTTGTDPKHVKLLKYQTEEDDHACDDRIHSNGYHTDDMDDLSMEAHLVREPPSLVEVSIQPSAVHVEVLPSVPVQITLPIMNRVILTEPVKEAIDEDQETANATLELEKNCPPD